MSSLYHYCSNDSFYSIIESQSIRLSSLSLSNDTKEGKLVADIINHLATQDKIGENEIFRLQRSVKAIEDTIEGLGFCLSEEGDLLSQWRGYASDASGASIGFSKKYLEELSNAIPNDMSNGFSVAKVIYDETEQIDLLIPTYNEVKKLIAKGAYQLPKMKTLLDARTQEEIEKENEDIKKKSLEAGMTVFGLFTEVYRLKTAAFREEKEWRLISHYIKLGIGECLYRASSNTIIPYREFKIKKLNNQQILEVILGPKNITPNYVVEQFLEKNGFYDVKVLRSNASYR